MTEVHYFIKFYKSNLLLPFWIYSILRLAIQLKCLKMEATGSSSPQANPALVRVLSRVNECDLVKLA
jgi:hypothetical protein